MVISPASMPGTFFAETYEINDTGVYAGVLADNGGPTMTVALKDDASNPALGLSDPSTTRATSSRMS